MKIIMIVLVICFMSNFAYAENEKDLYQKGIQALKDGKYEEAVDNLEQASEMVPNSSKLFNVLGVAYLRSNNYESAIRSFEQAIDFDENNAEAIGNLGNIYMENEKNVVLAAEYFERAIQINPTYARGYLGLGWIELFEKKNPKKAEVLFEKVIQIEPENVEAQYALGMSYIALKNQALALKPISVLRTLNRTDLSLNLESMMQEKSDASKSPSKEIVDIEKKPEQVGKK